MIPNHKAMQRAMMIAQDIAQQIDPAYGRVNLPPTAGGIPEEYQQGGAIVDPNVLNELAKSAVSAINKSRAGLAYGGISDERDQIENAGSYFEAPAEERGLPDAGGVRGGESVLPAPVQTRSPEPLEGLPTQVKIPMTGEMIEAGPDERIRKVAEDYMRSIGREYKPASVYAKVEPERASRIAQAYHEMKHDPSDSFVRSAYDQMLKETMDQYQAAKEAGFKAEFWNPEKDEDPYKASPRLAIKDINENHHMYVFPTRAGFGSDEEMAAQLKDNPLLADSGERWNGEPVTYNDIFRAVHDYYGHAKEGVGFRADGEENAWRSHASMYSPLARLAMTSETRGQNSWLNYGPHGERNRNARTEDTIFADQKIGLLPAFAIHEGAEDFMRPEDVAEVRQLYKRTKRAEGGEVDAPQGYTPQPPGTLETDNPGGEWLEEKKEYSASRGYRPSGAPMSFGEVTAVWSDRKKNEMAPVYLPVSMLKQIPGVMNEQQNVREHSLSGLVEHMGSTGRLPKSGTDSDREYHPFITVDQRGMPFVSEGNHRIMAADRLGWKWLPVEVRYFNGAEQIDGPLHPDRIRAMHGVEPAKKAEGGAVDVAEVRQLYKRTKREKGGATINTPVLDKDKAIRRALRIAKQEGGLVGAPQIGINVRSDTKAGIRYADEIVDGNKAYETRDTDSLRPYVGKRVAIVRTGEGPAKAIGEVTVGKPIVADQDMFRRLRDQHLVPAGSAFDIEPGSTKHLYPMHDPVRYDNERGVGAGIVARKVMERAKGGPITKAEGGPLSGGMQSRGLDFPAEDSAFRLRTKLNREAKVASGKADPGLPSNPRMTIRAPEAEEGGNQLPDFVVGPVTPQDWIDRHEQILSPDEITHASQWYKNIYGNFLQYTNNDEAQAKPLMRAWLVAQQNVSPAGAMQNVLLQKEQMQRGVPENMWRAGGMPNPTNAARAVLQDKPIAGGVGQKISDFVDSAEGLDTRSFLGHDQKGGKPFVIDVHSARDTGLVDPALLNHLRGLGYNEEDLAKVQTDFEASPSDAQYENRAQWGRDLTDHLNSIKWQGKNDWRPEEIQAVGWMGMTKLTRNAEEDSASGLARNLRRVSFELAPGEGSPWAAKYGEAFNTLPDDERALITQTMGGRAMEIANELAQTHAVNTVYGTGAWQQYQNPAAVAQVLATEQGADILAHSIGHLLHQTEVWHNRAKPMTANPKGFAIDFIEKGSNNLADKGQLQDFWSKVMDADKTGLVQGYQPITLPSGESGVRVLVDKGGKKTSENLFKALSADGELGTMLKSLPYDVQAQLAEAEISKARNDWKENPNGELYVQGLRDILGSDPSARLSAAGSQLEKELEALLDQAYTRQGRAWRTAQGPEEGQVTAVKPKKTRAKAKEPPEPTAGMASGGIVDRALRVAEKARRPKWLA